MKTMPKAIADGFLTDPADLSNLAIIPADKVRQFVDTINALTEADLKGRKIVAAIGTGGTISMRTENGIRSPDLNCDKILQYAESVLEEKFKIIALDAFQIGSAQMHFGHIRDLAIALTYAWQNIKQPFIGFLILHGTDTLSYAGAAMSLIMGQGLPFSICYTAAQKPIQEPMSDAGTNLRNALFTLEALHDNNMAEVVTVVGDTALLSSTAIKIDGVKANAFDAPLHHPVSNFSSLDYPIKLANWLAPKRNQDFSPTIWNGNYSHTLQVFSHLALNPDFISERIHNPDIAAVLFYSYGSGEINDHLAETIMKTAKEKQCPVFIANPINNRGSIAYEPLKNMINNGATYLMMTPTAALAKIEIALRKHPGDIKSISDFMTTSYVGEIPCTTSGSQTGDL